jgi:ACS family hexuronate transporter-like MFS transporter
LKSDLAAAARRQATDPSSRVGGYRWFICGLLFLSAAINYIDRQVIGILKPTLQQQFGWTEIDYGDIVVAFQLAYAIGLVASGRLMDRLGTRAGLALSVLLWSAAAMAHAGALNLGPWAATALSGIGVSVTASVAGFIVVRFALGLTEAANFPAAIKAVAEWFPQRERALATGLLNAGVNVGAVLAPLIVPWLTIAFGWRWAFIGTGAIGSIWLVMWWRTYSSPERHPRVGRTELEYINSDPAESHGRVPWLAVMRHRQAWAFALGKLLTDPVWFLYVYWIPDFLHRNYGLDLTSMGPPIVAIYLLADLGSVAGGWFSSWLIKRGWSVNAGRKTAMLGCALAVTPVVFAARASNVAVAVGLIGLATAAHQGWSANLFTLTSDTFPRRAVGSVVGFGAMVGSIGAMLIARLTASVLQWTGSYVPVFAIAASAYLCALCVIHLFAPRLAPVELIDA